VAAGGCCIRITLRAVSSASSSAGSRAFETFAGKRDHFEECSERWMDGAVVILTGACRSFVSPEW
jgi:hypothetical protein